MEITRRGITTGTLAIFAASTIPGVSLAMIEPVATPDNIIITPDIHYCDRCVVFEEENTRTLIYEVMSKWNFTTKQLHIAKVGTPVYDQWMKDHPPTNGIPHHISFGGAVVAGERDPTFHSRWYERTLAHLRSGVLA